MADVFLLQPFMKIHFHSEDITSCKCAFIENASFMPPSNPPQQSSGAPQALEAAIRPAVQSLYNLQTQIVNNTSSSPQIIQNTVNEFLAHLRNISEIAAQPAQEDLTVPPEILNYLDEGRNPDIFIREYVERTMSDNQRLKGKMEGFARFRDVLAREIVGGVPDMEGDVRLVVPDLKMDTRDNT
jgi:mediator of RNA polymerase II transcription subunit 10